MPAISALIDYLQPKSILDYGCGKGGLVKALAEKYPKIKVYGYDPAVEQFSIMPVDKVDLVVNTDVLEHIPEDELPETVQRIASISQNVFFHLHHGSASQILENGENAHCTIWTPQQYAELFKKYFSTINFLPGHTPINTTCLTFSLPYTVMTRWEHLIKIGTDDFVKNLSNFINLISGYKENIIFPLAGWQGGNIVLDYLNYTNNIEKICCIAAEQVQDDIQEQFVNGRPIIPLKFLLHFRNTAAIYVVAPDEYYQSAKTFLKKIGFQNVLFIGKNLVEQINSELTKLINSGLIIRRFIEDTTKKLRELEFRIAEQEEISKIHTAAFAEYRNAFRVKKVVIVGSGPTAKYYKPIPDAIHIALNFSWRREDIKFDFLFTGDAHTNSNSEIKMQDGFKKIRQKIFVLKSSIDSNWRFLNFGENVSLIDKVLRFYSASNSYTSPIFQDISLHPLFGVGTIAEPALSFALFTYPAEIYLVGCDVASNGYFYENPNPNYIIGNKNMSTHKMKVGYARLKMFAKQYYPDTRIISINPVGLKGLFEDIFTEDYLKE